MPFAISPAKGDGTGAPRFFRAFESAPFGRAALRALRAGSRVATRIHYEVRESLAGAGAPAVVLIQGLGLSSRFWFDLPDRLTQDWRVVLLDNRGAGRSDKPRGPYRMATMADDVAAVLDAAQIERACVVGISLGGMIAQHVALRHPARVAGLVLLATTAGFPHARLPRMKSLATLIGLPIARRIRPPAQVGRAVARLLLSERDVPRARELLSAWPAALRADPMTPSTYFAQLAAVLGHAAGFRLRRLGCPTVVVTGDDDVLIPPHNSRLLARLVPDAHLEVVAGCGHAIPASDPDCIARALARLMRRERSRVADGR
jgi:pimeloyl-ACP methyl ester carboxylesterase